MCINGYIPYTARVIPVYMYVGTLIATRARTFIYSVPFYAVVCVCHIDIPIVIMTNVIHAISVPYIIVISTHICHNDTYIHMQLSCHTCTTPVTPHTLYVTCLLRDI